MEPNAKAPEDKLVVFSTSMDKPWLWILVIGCWFLGLLVVFDQSRLLHVSATTALWAFGILVLGAVAVALFTSSEREVSVQPSKSQWSITRRSSLRPDQVETHFASAIERIEIASIEFEGKLFWVEVCNHDGRRIELTKRFYAEEEAHVVASALAFASHLGLTDKIVRTPCR